MIEPRETLPKGIRVPVHENVVGASFDSDMMCYWIGNSGGKTSRQVAEMTMLIHP